MAQARTYVHSMCNGEVSTSALARVDQEKAKLWAETQENLFPFTIGKAMMRPGTTYLGDADDHTKKVRGIVATRQRRLFPSGRRAHPRRDTVHRRG